MSDRLLPEMDPTFVTKTIDALPNRLQSRLCEADPESWLINGNIVRVGTATVNLVPPGDASCSCLLSPRCLHLAQVLTACPTAEKPSADRDDETETHEPDNPQCLSTAQLRSLEQAEECLTMLLARGLGSLTPMDRAAVLRAVSALRVHELPSLASKFSRLHGSLSEQPTDMAIAVLADAALSTQCLRYEHDTKSLKIETVGSARRSYAPVGALRLTGWACEPVVTATGYSGVVTHLVDSDGVVWTLSTVIPGNASLVAQTYHNSVDLGDLSLSHHELARSGVLVSDATATADRHLGRGGGVRASSRRPDAKAAPKDDWWQGDVTLSHIEDDGLHPVFVLTTKEGPLYCQATPAAEQLGLSSIRWLAQSASVRVRVRLRVRRADEFGRAPWLLIGICFNDEWIFPGLDHAPEELPETPRRIATVPTKTAEKTPSAVLRRWRDAVARQGFRAVTEAGRSALIKDAAWLRSHASSHRADALEQLAAAAAAGSTAFDGRFVPDLKEFRRRWLAVAAMS